MVDMDVLIAMIRTLNACGKTLQEIHQSLVVEEECPSYEFFLAYKGAEMLPGWKTPESHDDTQAFYDQLFV